MGSLGLVQRMTFGQLHASDAGAWEEYRYDALGRRILLRARRSMAQRLLGCGLWWRRRRGKDVFSDFHGPYAGLSNWAREAIAYGERQVAEMQYRAYQRAYRETIGQLYRAEVKAATLQTR